MDRYSAVYFAPAFRRAGFGMLGFDCSGQGERFGDLKASSLERRRGGAFAVVASSVPGLYREALGTASEVRFV